MTFLLYFLTSSTSLFYERNWHPDPDKIYIFLNKFIYLFLFLAVLGLRCCTRAFSSCSKRGLLFVAVRRFLIVVASLVAEHRLQARGLSSCGLQALERRLSSCGARAQLLRGMWDLPRPGIEPVCPALAGGFLTTGPPGKPKIVFLRHQSAIFSQSAGFPNKVVIPCLSTSFPDLLAYRAASRLRLDLVTLL